MPSSRPALLAISFLLALGLSSCARNNGSSSGDASPVNQAPKAPDATPTPDASPLSDATGVGNIKFDGALSPKERGAFVAAMDWLEASNVQNPDSRLLEYMKIRSFDRISVRDWLESRIQYIVSENADESKLVQLQSNYNGFENPGQLPPAIKNGLGGNNGGGRVNEDKGHVVMSNIGALIYLVGKAKSTLYGVKADGIGTIAMTSPRSGVLQIGEGLFGALPKEFPAKYPNVVRLFHLSTLLHESRHSDGHGETTGFLHEKCKSGDYAGMNACDHNLNGPYEIEALATKALMDSCQNCSTKEKQIMKVLYLDTASRRIDDAQTTAWDDAPEGHR
jgi:hypothetical protein